MRARQVFAKDMPLDPRGGEHLFLIDDHGRLWERFSDDSPGKWTEIPLPKMTYKTSRKSRKK